MKLIPTDIDGTPRESVTAQCDGLFLCPRRSLNHLADLGETLAHEHRCLHDGKST